MMNAMRKRLGMIAPSSNSVLEPVTYAMLTGVPGISAHFSRFRVTEIALDAEALDQFDPSRMLPAADLLADAKVEAMAWNGTSASWLGIERDRSLVKLSVHAPENLPRRRRWPASMRCDQVERSALAS
jgi:maleate isomerase